MSRESPGGDETESTGWIAERARRAARWVRRLPDRLLHPRRRRRARERLSGGARSDGPVLFICHGNICRSPYAEKVLAREARGRLAVTSAGLMGPDRPSPETARQVAAERGVDLEAHRSRLVTTELLRSACLVVVMEPYQARALHDRHGFRRSLVLGDLDPEPVERRPIRDPIFRPPELFREVYDRIDRCVDEMLDAMGLPSAPGDEGSEAEEAGPARADGGGARDGTRDGAGAA